MTPKTLLDQIREFQNSRIILTGFELGVFTIINDTGKTTAEVALAIHADTRGIDRLLNALVALDLLEKNDQIFTNTTFAAQFLVKGKPDYLGGINHSINLWKTWSTLTEAVVAGHKVATSEMQFRQSGAIEGFIHAMHDRAFKAAPAIIAKLNLTGVKKVLDVGGGSGAYSMGFVNAGDISATVFDLPDVVNVSQKFIDKEGFTGRISTLAGDYLVDDFGNGYDLVFLSAIVHINSYDENKMLIQRCADTLNAGGQIVIQDYIMNDNRTQPSRGTAFALNMLVGTDYGDTYTETEVAEWFTAAGLKNIHRIDAIDGNSLMIGRK